MTIDIESVCYKLLELSNNLKLIPFDIFNHDDLSLKERREILHNIQKTTDLFTICNYIYIIEKCVVRFDHTDINFLSSITVDDINAQNIIKKCMEYCVSNNKEGVVIKQPNSKYEYKRSSKWLKFKPERDTLDLLVVDEYKGKGKYKDIFSVFKLHGLNCKLNHLHNIDCTKFLCNVFVGNVKKANEIHNMFNAKTETVVEIKYALSTDDSV